MSTVTPVVRLVLYPSCFQLSVYRPYSEFRKIYIKEPKFWNPGIFKIYSPECVIGSLKHRGYKFKQTMGRYTPQN